MQTIHIICYDRQVEIFEEKELYRKRIRQRLAEHQKLENLHVQEEAAKQLLLSSQSYQQVTTVLAYAATHQELSLDKFIQQALMQGKNLFLPKSYPHNFSMEFFQLDNKLSLQQQLVCGSYGIREPHSHLPLLAMDAISSLSLILIPGLAFTRDGKRLGKGKGYYDRFLSHIPFPLPIQKRPILMGVCHSFQVKENLPTEKTDVKMDYILTPSKIITCNP